MRKTFSILDQYGGVIQQFLGTEIQLRNGIVEISDYDEKSILSYVKAYHCLAPGTTICHTEEVNG